jgi:hypothetical protein
VVLNYLFAFAAVWGVGGRLEPCAWEAFDGAAKDILEGTANFPGGARAGANRDGTFGAAGVLASKMCGCEGSGDGVSRRLGPVQLRRRALTRATVPRPHPTAPSGSGTVFDYHLDYRR